MTFEKLLVFINAIVPLALLAYDGWTQRLGANPVEFFLRTTGVLALIFLVLSLAVTPLRKMFGWNQLIKVRRMLGLFAFFYASIHLLTYSAFDKGGDVPAIAIDVWDRPFIAVGMTAFMILVPLAVTSTNKMIKRLGGKRWARLHKLAYAAATLGVTHFWMLVKSDVTYPALFGIAVAALLGYRIYAANYSAGAQGSRSAG